MKSTVEHPTIFIGVSEYGEFSHLYTLCKKIEVRLGLHPVFIFSSEYGMWKEHSHLVENANWSWVMLGYRSRQSLVTRQDQDSGYGYVPQQRSAPDWFQGLAYVVWAVSFLVAPIFLLRRVGRWLGRHLNRARKPTWRAQLEHAKRLHDKLRPDLVLSGQDFILSVTSMLAVAGRKHGTATAIVPYSMPPTTREVIESFAYFGHLRITSTLDLLRMLAIDPKLLNRYRGHTYARVSASDALAAKLCGLMPPEPWVPNSGCGYVFVPSQQAHDYYRRAGIPAEQLRMTGAAWSDRIEMLASSTKARKQKLLSRVWMHLESDRKRSGAATKQLREHGRVVFMSWPPNQWPRKATGCMTYEDLCHQFVSALKPLQDSGLAYVVVNMHPNVNDTGLLKLLTRSGIYVLRSSLLEHIDCADIFISTVSSTSFWAMHLGIPTINFDGYLYGYTEFEQAGAITVTTPQQAADECEKLLADPRLMELTRDEIRSRMKYFTMYDGKCEERILGELNLLRSKGTEP